MGTALGPQYSLEQNSDGSRGGHTSPPAKSRKAAKNSMAGKRTMGQEKLSTLNDEGSNKLK